MSMIGKISKHAFIALSLLVAFLVFQTSGFAANDYSTGLLNGKPLLVVDRADRFTSTETTNLATDNDEATFYALGKASPTENVKDILLYKFDTPRTISAYQVSANAGVKLFFVNASGVVNELPAITRTGEKIAYSISNVVAVSIQSTSTTTGVNIAQFEVYGVPLAPQLTASASSIGITLNWSSNSEDLSYIVSKSTSPSGPFTIISNSVTGSTYEDPQVEQGITYYYTVKAVNNEGQSPNSNIASATPAIVGDAVLTIIMINGMEKEYALTKVEAYAFIDWYDARANGIGKERYTFKKIGIQLHSKPAQIMLFLIKSYFSN